MLSTASAWSSIFRTNCDKNSSAARTRIWLLSNSCPIKTTQFVEPNSYVISASTNTAMKHVEAVHIS